jgi:hypothetical protein
MRLPAVPKFRTSGIGRPAWAWRRNSRASAIAAFTLPTPQYNTGTPARSNTPSDSAGSAITTSGLGKSAVVY